MEKNKYTEYVKAILEAHGWEAGYPNRPHWLAGNQEIFGPTVTNPITGRKEYFILSYEKPWFQKMRVTLLRIIYDTTLSESYERYNIDLTKNQVSDFVRLLPMINKTIDERIAQQDADSEVKREEKNWWP